MGFVGFRVDFEDLAGAQGGAVNVVDEIIIGVAYEYAG